MNYWHSKTIEQVIEELSTDVEAGLPEGEIRSRLEQFGPNELRERRGRSPWLIMLEQFTEPLVILLIVAAAVAALIHEVVDSLFIGFILVANAVIGFTQEYRAERAVAALRRMAAPTATVTRDGEPKEIAAREVVPGDIVLLEAGMQVVADMRIVEARSLRIDEAALTGESFPVSKVADRTLSEKTGVGDRTNMGFSGTMVTAGRGRGVVVATGMDTQVGQIADLLQTTEEAKTPLQQRMAQAGKWLVGAVVVICAVVFVGGLLRGNELYEMFLTGVSLAVAAVPEGLPAVVTITLALGAQRMVQRNALIRRLPAVETLGSVTVICSDKTGTLTQGNMTVQVACADDEMLTVSEIDEGRRAEFQRDGQNVDIAEYKDFAVLLRAMALCSDARVTKLSRTAEKATGDPTEVALVRVAAQAGLVKDDLEQDFARIDEIPFDSQRKRMTTLHRVADGQLVSYTKGAMESVLDRSISILRNGQIHPLSEDDKQRIMDRQYQLAARGLRLLAAAFRQWDEVPAMEPDHAEQDLVFIGLVGMSDPARPEAGPAIETCNNAGIKAVMVTGDHKVTATSIAEQLAMLPSGARVVTGAELQDFSPEQLTDQVDEISVYARVSPQDKIDIVEAWQQRGQIVAMTGDGVNDAPALKKADIGVAMGQMGTDVSKEASDMILLDDNFATIVVAVEYGRVIYDNIRKFFRYMLSTNSGEILTMFGSILLGWPLPLLPAQILWINLVTDGLPALALGVEPAEEDVMDRPPRDPEASIFAGGMATFIGWVGVYMALCALGLFWYILQVTGEITTARTACFAVLAYLQMANVLAIRSETKHLWEMGLGSNPQLLGAVILTVILQLAVTYVPWLQTILHTTALSAGQMLLCVGIAATLYFIVELEKTIRRRA